MNYAITMLIAFIVAFISTPLIKKLAIKLGVVDIPKDNRRMHNTPIALLGGAAMVIGFLIALFYNIIIGDIMPDRSVAGMLVGILILLVCGFLDDRYVIKWKFKALFQLAAAISFVVISDLQIGFLTNPFMFDEVFEFSPFISWPLTVLWIVALTNAINFIDGLDGLAAGVSCISALSLFFVSILSQDMLQSPVAPLLMAALAGSALGFLPFNFNPAKIFMGETGAAFLGFSLAVVSIQGLLKSYAMISLAIPILIIGLPIFDVIFAIFRRLSNKTSPARPDSGHLHHKLMKMGLSQRQSVILLYITSAVLGLCGLIFANKNYISAVVLLILLPVFVFVCAKYFVGENLAKNNDGAQNGISGGDGGGGGSSGSSGSSGANSIEAAHNCIGASPIINSAIGERKA